MWLKIQELIDKGEFEQAQEKLQLILGEDTRNNDKLQKEIYLLKIKLGKADFEYIANNAHKILKEFKIQENNPWYFQIQNIYLESLWRSNYFDDALKIGLELNLKNQIIDTKEMKEQFGYLLYNLARIHLYLGDFKKAQSFALESLEIRKCLPSKIDLSETYNVIGIIHGYKGESNKAIDSYEKSMQLRREIGNIKLTAYSLNNIGENYRLKGDFKKALNYYDQCYQMCLKANDIEGMRLGLVGKGTIFMNTGDLSKSLENYEECLSLFSASLSPYHQIEILFLIVRLKLLMKIDYKKELEKIYVLNKKFNDKTIKFFVKLTEAFVIKENPRIKIKLTAQDLFEEIVHEDIVNMEFTMLAMESLVELYLIELQISDNTLLLNSINQLIHDMLNIANEQNFYPLMIRTIILESRLAFLNDDLGNCLHILEKAKLLAQNNDLHEFLPLIEQENQFISEELTKWQSLVEKDASMYQKIQESNLLLYLQDIKRVLKK